MIVLSMAPDRLAKRRHKSHINYVIWFDIEQGAQDEMAYYEMTARVTFAASPELVAEIGQMVPPGRRRDWSRPGRADGDHAGGG
jgi:hypothetical protein